MSRTDLEYIWQWANWTLVSGTQPAWVWEQYFRLCEVLDALDRGLNNQSEHHRRGVGGQLVLPHLKGTAMPSLISVTPMSRPAT